MGAAPGSRRSVGCPPGAIPHVAPTRLRPPPVPLRIPDPVATMRNRYSTISLLVVVVAACGGSDTGATTSIGATAMSSTTSSTVVSAPVDTGGSAEDGCGHDLDPQVVSYGFNEVVDADGAVKAPQGRPLQEGDTLVRADARVTAPNAADYAQVAAFMMPIRDALMCDIATTTAEEWQDLTRVLALNGIKTTQDLTGTPPEQYYSTDGIFEHLQAAGDFNAMMKYLEEAELELKCLAFVDFDFTNPEGENHCRIQGLEEGSGLVLP